MSKKAERVAAFVAGVAFIITIILLAVKFPNPTPFQYTVFRIVLAVAAAGFAAMIPGFIEIHVNNSLRATGALAVFAVVYFFNPAKLLVEKDWEPSKKREFEIYVNDRTRPVTNRMTIELGKDRRISFYLKNIGTVGAENVTLHFCSPINTNQISFTRSWLASPAPIDGRSRQVLTGMTCLRVIHRESFPNDSWVAVPPLTISSNVPSPVYSGRELGDLGWFSTNTNQSPDDLLVSLPALVHVYADSSKAQVLKLFFRY